jgi:hypothetical protein
VRTAVSAIDDIHDLSGISFLRVAPKVDFDPDEIVTFAGKEMTVRAAIRRLLADLPQRSSEFPIVRDGREFLLTTTDLEHLARKWGVMP